MVYDVNKNFVFPSKLVDGLILGWNESCEIQIWPPGENVTSENDARKVLDMLKKKKMVTATPIEKVELKYMIMTKDTHVAELHITFEDAYKHME